MSVQPREEVELGELEGEDRGPLLSPAGERRQLAPVVLETEVVAVWPPGVPSTAPRARA